MESEPKARAHHRKRRERAMKIQPDLSDSEGEKLGDEQSPLRGSKERSRSKPRKKKSPGTYEEDIIDGFAIVSFKSIEDLEKYTQGKLTNKAGGDKCTPKRNKSISPSRNINRHGHAKKKDKKPANIQKSRKHNNSAADSDSSGETTDNLDTTNLILNGPKKISRTLSDVSTRSSSGAGYLCDSESGDERVSDGSLDIFQPVTNSINNSITCERTLPASLPPVSTHSATVTTATHTTTTTGSDVITTVVTAATTCVSVATSSLNTTSVIVTTAHHTVNTTSSSPAIHHSHNNSSRQHEHRGYHVVTSVENRYHPDSKYSTHVNHHTVHKHEHQLKVQNEREHNRDSSHGNNYLSVIKRRPASSPPPLTKSSHQPSSNKSGSHPYTASSATALVPSTLGTSVIHRDSSRPTPPSRSKTPRREDPRDIYPTLPPSLSASKSFFTSGYPGHVPVVSTLYSPLGPSPGFHQLHSTPSHSTFQGSGISALPPHQTTPPQPHPANMFAPPMPLGLPGAPPIPGPLVAPPASHLPTEPPLSSPDLLREELNRRFLAAHQDRSLLNSLPPLMRADIHQHMHQHQHQHQHMHQHTYHTGMPPPAISSSLVPTPTPSPFDKVASSPFFRQGIPGLPGFPSPLPDALHTGIPGAFQPKGLAGLHPAVGPLFIPGRELEKPVTSHIPPQAPPPLPASARKPGKWCAVHVRIAWEIYHHQQKQSTDKGSETKPGDPLRPPGHLLQGSTLPRPPDLPNSANSALLGGSGRGLFDTNPHSLLNSASHLAPSFPRPSPYSIGSSLPLSLGNGLSSSSRDPGPSVPSGSQEWARLHCTPPTFPSPWTKAEDREKEEREREIDRRREEDRERERRMLDQDRHRFSSHDERSRDRERYRENELLSHRSRSRSPMRNGRSDSVKSDRSYDRRTEENSITKVKEERRESLTRDDDLIAAERERLLKNDFLASSLRTTDVFMQASMMDRARMLTPAAAYSMGERVPPHPALWNPYDKGPMDFGNLRLNLQREMEQARENLLLNRFPGPGMQLGFPGLSPQEQDRFREELLLREKRERDYFERLPVYARERMLYENSKIPTLRPDHLHPSLANSFSRNISPAQHNHIKRSSPAVLPGAPPPLIPTASSQSSRTHNSPAVNKSKGVSPTDSVGESKRDSNSNSTDPDAHSR